jgi:hypothetical protein
MSKEELFNLIPREYNFLKTEFEYETIINQIYNTIGIQITPNDNIINFIPTNSSALMLSMIGKKFGYKSADTLYLFTQIIKELDLHHLLWRYYNTNSATERNEFKNNYMKFVNDDRINNEININSPSKITVFINSLTEENDNDIKNEFMNIPENIFKDKYCSSDSVIRQVYILLSNKYNRQVPSTLCTQTFENTTDKSNKFIETVKSYSSIIIIVALLLVLLVSYIVFRIYKKSQYY